MISAPAPYSSAAPITNGLRRRVTSEMRPLTSPAIIETPHWTSVDRKITSVTSRVATPS